MNGFIIQAKAKLEEGNKSRKFDRYAAAMKDAVKAQLIDFCEQDGEFAQAVVQGGSFEDCMAAVAKNCGTSLSDLEAYRRAVQFYFPGAELKMQMTIDLIGAAGAGDTGNTGSGIILNLSDFL